MKGILSRVQKGTKLQVGEQKKTVRNNKATVLGCKRNVSVIVCADKMYEWNSKFRG